MLFEKNNKRTMHGWAMYDWANSVFSLTIATAVFPAYFDGVMPKFVRLFGSQISSTTLYAYMLSFSFLLIAFLSPILSGIADYKGNKKSFMKFFCYVGSLACISMFFFDSNHLYVGIFGFIISMICFAGSIVFYNAYLPEIVTQDKMDALSSKGYSLGYIGSVILLIFNLAMIQKPELFGIDPTSNLPARISFLSVGIWWAGFAQITFSRLPKGVAKHPDGNHILLKGIQQLKKTYKEVKKIPFAAQFLLSFFIYSMGLQTVMYIAQLYGSKEIGLEIGTLITTILIIQLVAILGATIFAKISKLKGNIFSLMCCLVIWVGICIYAYYLPKYDATGFFIVGGLVGLVMGGIQALSRSAFSKLLPEAEEHTTFFSFYDMVEKISIVLGTFIWGFLEQITQNMRAGVLVLAVFFIAGGFMLMKVKSNKLRATI